MCNYIPNWLEGFIINGRFTPKIWLRKRNESMIILCIEKYTFRSRWGVGIVKIMSYKRTASENNYPVKEWHKCVYMRSNDKLSRETCNNSSSWSLSHKRLWRLIFIIFKRRLATGNFTTLVVCAFFTDPVFNPFIIFR